MKVTLEQAIAAAARIHAEQKDKAGAPYILHALRVLLAGATEEERILGVLHDTVEDRGWEAVCLELVGSTSWSDLPSWLEKSLDSISRREGESYEAFIVRCGANPLARRVKMKDLRDNLNLGRLPSPGPADLARHEKYLRAFFALEQLESGVVR